MTQEAKILHIDFNAFFASVEQQANPFLQNKAIAVGGKATHKPSIITTASYTAKRLGVKTAMSVQEAMRICPELILVAGRPHLYSFITDQLIKVLRRYTDRVVQTSIDEAYMDITDIAPDWFEATAIALQIRDTIAQDIGPLIRVSIGIAPNALTAKLASGSEKPNGLVVVSPQEHAAFLQSQPLSAIGGIGSAILRRLKEQGISTPEALLAQTRSFLQTHFKQYGDFLYNAYRPYSSRALPQHLDTPKSIGHAHTLPYALLQSNSVHHRLVFLRPLIRSLCEQVAWRVRSHGLCATALTLTLNAQSQKTTNTHPTNGTSVRIRLSAPSHDGLLFFRSCWPIVKQSARQATPRLVGVTAHTFTSAHVQEPLEQKQQKHLRLLPTLDTLRARFGRTAWSPLASLHTQLPERASGFRFDHIP